MSEPGRFVEPDIAAWVRLLDEFEVAYVVVGGIGARLHGANRPTMDIDVVPAWVDANLARLCLLLRSIEAHSTSGPPLAANAITPAELIEREITTWATTLGRIDVLVGIPDAQGLPVTYDELIGRGETQRIDTTEVVVANLEDIITSKEHANRAKDRAALPELYRLLRVEQDRL